MPYPEMLVAPMRDELTQFGFKEMKTGQEVEQELSNQDGTVLVMVNSVCGCAAGSARPGVIQSLNASHKPTKLLTVFAGQDLEATAKARDYFTPYPPSSPAIALFKNGELVHFIERMNIEGRTAEMIAANLEDAYNKHCN